MSTASLPTTYPPIYLPACLPSCLPTILPVNLPTDLPENQSINQSTCLPAYLPACLLACLLSCLPYCLRSRPVPQRFPHIQMAVSTVSNPVPLPTRTTWLSVPSIHLSKTSTTLRPATLKSSRTIRVKQSCVINK